MSGDLLHMPAVVVSRYSKGLQLECLKPLTTFAV